MEIHLHSEQILPVWYIETKQLEQSSTLCSLREENNQTKQNKNNNKQNTPEKIQQTYDKGIDHHLKSLYFSLFSYSSQ